MTTRWRIPPENSCGNARMRTSAFGMPTVFSSSMPRCQAAAWLTPRCAVMASTS